MKTIKTLMLAALFAAAFAAGAGLAPVGSFNENVAQACNSLGCEGG